MNFYFFIHRQIEFQNFFPVAKEIRKKFSKSNIYFIFNHYLYYKNIIKDDFIKKELEKNFKVIKIKTEYLHVWSFKRVTFYLFLYTFLFLKILRFKNIFFFPSLKFSKYYKFLIFMNKSLKGKNIYLAKNRSTSKSAAIHNIDDEITKVINFNQNDIEIFDYFVFYHSDNIILKRINLINF